MKGKETRIHGNCRGKQFSVQGVFATLTQADRLSDEGIMYINLHKGDTQYGHAHRTKLNYFQLITHFNMNVK